MQEVPTVLDGCAALQSDKTGIVLAEEAPKCQNGGVVSLMNTTCFCPRGFIGNLCEKIGDYNAMFTLSGRSTGRIYQVQPENTKNLTQSHQYWANSGSVPPPYNPQQPCVYWNDSVPEGTENTWTLGDCNVPRTFICQKFQFDNENHNGVSQEGGSCSDPICVNGGTRVSQEARCECRKGYTGIHCQDEHVQPTTLFRDGRTKFYRIDTNQSLGTYTLTSISGGERCTFTADTGALNNVVPSIQTLIKEAGSSGGKYCGN
ncbi:hypothetical protein RB195_000404 [Necator americanus]|uniref:EGF-like domain-containing protein n=1 Tax=Necator americanus TaxID=51031 RepID=A0ABR1DB86_NECAM